MAKQRRIGPPRRLPGYFKGASPAYIDPRDVLPMDTTPTPCYNATRQGDEYTCLKCRIRWDVHEERPPCPMED